MISCISVSDLTKVYDERTVVDSLSFQVDENEIFGLLGPNGAGKTTTLEMIAGIRRASAGSVQIREHEVRRDRSYVVNTVAVQQQESSVFQFLTVEELVSLQASFYRSPRPVDETIELAGLTPQRGQRFARLSGGQKRRLSFGLAVVGNTDILVLDEPAAGLDPSARIGLQDSIRYLQSLNKTVLYTTHHLEEATDLCDRVAIIAGGRMQIVGSPQSLIDQYSSSASVTFELVDNTEADKFKRWAASVSSFDEVAVTPNGSVALSTSDSDECLKQLHVSGIRFRKLKIANGNLNDVYTSMVKEK